MKAPAATREQQATRSLICNLLNTRLVSREQYREQKYNCDVKNLIGAPNIFHLSDSRKIQGLYRQENGEILVVYVAWGMGQTYVITEAEYQALRFADTVTPQNVYFEF